MIDALGKVLIELRDDAAFGTWCGERVRGEDPMPATATYDGDVHSGGPDDGYRRFCVIRTLATPQDKRVPIQRPRYAVLVFGTSRKDAMEGYTLAATALHRAGVRMAGTGSSRLGIWNTWDDTGGTPDLDPDTNQPFVTFVVALIGTSQAVPA